MSKTSSTSNIAPGPVGRDHGLLARVVQRVAGAAARRPKLTVALWLVLIVACVAAGSLAGMR